MLARAVHDRNIIVDVMTHTDSVRGMKLAYDGIIKSKAKHIASEPTAIRKARIGDLFGN
jgi:hypothetical protein